MTRCCAPCARPRRRPAGSSTARWLREIERAGYRSDSPRRCRWRSRCGSPRRAGRPRRPGARGGSSRRRLGGHAPARARVRQRRAGQGPVRRPDRRAARRLRAASPSTAAATSASPARAHASRSPTPSAARRCTRFRLARVGAWPPAGSAGAAGSAPTAAPRITCSTPSTGRPAFTGVVQATALAPTAVEAEWRAKAAVLSGPDAARDWLPHGGVVVLDDGSTSSSRPRRHR